MTALRLDRLLPAPPQRVWTALTDPTTLAQWFWPASFGTVVTADVRTGGALRIDAPGRIAVTGTYVAVEPPRRLVFTWRWDGEDEETLVTVELSAVAEGTGLRLTHERFPDQSTLDNHRQGWSDCLSRLSDLVQPAREGGRM